MNLQEVKNLAKDFLLETYAPADVAFVKGEGCKLYDMEGREYIDFASGIGVCSVGYAHPVYTQALSEQIHSLLHTSNLFFNPTQALLAQKLVELSGYDMQVFFANSGAEANEGAIKLARKYAQRDSNRYKIITLQSSFHGRTLATLTATGQDKLHPNYYAPYPEGFVVAQDLKQIYKLIITAQVWLSISLSKEREGSMPYPKKKCKNFMHICKKGMFYSLLMKFKVGFIAVESYLQAIFMA